MDKLKQVARTAGATVRQYALTAAVLAAPLVARADPVEPDITAITAAGTTVATIGAAVFVVMVGIKVFKWARRAL